MVCLGLVECQAVHRSALDYFLAVLIVVAAVVAARLLICAVVRCFDGGGTAVHHHHHNHHSPASTDIDDQEVAGEVWGAGMGMATYGRHAAQQQERRPEAVEVQAPVVPGAGQLERVLGS